KKNCRVLRDCLIDVAKASAHGECNDRTRAWVLIRGDDDAILTGVVDIPKGEGNPGLFVSHRDVRTTDDGLKLRGGAIATQQFAIRCEYGDKELAREL